MPNSICTCFIVGLWLMSFGIAHGTTSIQRRWVAHYDGSDSWVVSGDGSSMARIISLTAIELRSLDDGRVTDTIHARATDQLQSIGWVGRQLFALANGVVAIDKANHPYELLVASGDSMQRTGYERKTLWSKGRSITAQKISLRTVPGTLHLWLHVHHTVTYTDRAWGGTSSSYIDAVDPNDFSETQSILNGGNTVSWTSDQQSILHTATNRSSSSNGGSDVDFWTSTYAHRRVHLPSMKTVASREYFASEATAPYTDLLNDAIPIAVDAAGYMAAYGVLADIVGGTLDSTTRHSFLGAVAPQTKMLAYQDRQSFRELRIDDLARRTSVLVDTISGGGLLEAWVGMPQGTIVVFDKVHHRLYCYDAVIDGDSAYIEAVVPDTTIRMYERLQLRYRAFATADSIDVRLTVGDSTRSLGPAAAGIVTFSPINEGVLPVSLSITSFPSSSIVRHDSLSSIRVVRPEGPSRMFSIPRLPLLVDITAPQPGTIDIAEANLANDQRRTSTWRTGAHDLDNSHLVTHTSGAPLQASRSLDDSVLAASGQHENINRHPVKFGILRSSRDSGRHLGTLVIRQPYNHEGPYIQPNTMRARWHSASRQWMVAINTRFAGGDRIVLVDPRRSPACRFLSDSAGMEYPFMPDIADFDIGTDQTALVVQGTVIRLLDLTTERTVDSIPFVDSLPFRSAVRLSDGRIVSNVGLHRRTASSGWQLEQRLPFNDVLRVLRLPSRSHVVVLRADRDSAASVIDVDAWTVIDDVGQMSCLPTGATLVSSGDSVVIIDTCGAVGIFALPSIAVGIADDRGVAAGFSTVTSPAVAPNPSTGIVSVSASLAPDDQLLVTDILGTVVDTYTGPAGATTWHLSLHQGTYRCLHRTRTGATSTPIVVVR